MKGILDGYRVVDWSAVQAGPYGALLLADLGADVIHVESPEHGDAYRALKSMYGISLISPQGRHIAFEEHNRNKRGLTVDIRSGEGREVMYRLVETADVFLTNYRPPVVTELGMDYEVLRERNPSLVYGQASTFGPKGPDAGNPGFDPVGQARSGAMLASGEEGMPPVMLTLGIGDRVVSFALAYGIISALLARERYGVGQKVETSQLAAMVVLQGCQLTPTMVLNKRIPRHNRKVPPRNALLNYYQCKDGRWIAFASWQPKYWPTFCQAIGKPELQQDPRFSEELRGANGAALVEILEQVFLEKTSEEWCAQLKGAGDLVFAVVNELADVPADPQVIANDYVVDWDHPVLGTVKWPGYAVTFSKTPQVSKQVAPELGEHTEELLCELGYNWEQIISMRDKGVI